VKHQQLAQNASNLWVQKETSLPVLSNGHRNALGLLDRAFAGAQPLAILIGEGKSDASYLIGRFLAGIGDDTAVVRITEPCLDAIAGMREIICAIGFEPKDLSLTDLENVFTMFLSFQKTHHRRTIICMEEIQDYGWWVLDAVRRFVTLETEGRFGLMVMLSGRPSQNELLNEPLLDAICAQPEQCIALEPFTLAETREYIRWRIESAGTADIAQVFEFDAITFIHEFCAGAPDAVSDLCSRCLQLADEEDIGPVTTDLVKKAGELLRLASATQQPDFETESLEGNGVGPQRGRLVVRKDGVLVQEQYLKQGHILIGRHELCNIRIVSPPISRHHALIVSYSNGVTLIDLGSTNGTLINGCKIKRHMLQDNDVITVGDCAIEYVAGDDRKGWFLGIERTNCFELHNADYGDYQKLRTLRLGDGKGRGDQEGGAPEGCYIKGNINSKGDRIYHAPGMSSYSATRIDESKGECWFRSEEEASAAGWRAPRN
jgi:type II secretory pathway predicted ATPase ExeA